MSSSYHPEDEEESDHEPLFRRSQRLAGRDTGTSSRPSQRPGKAIAQPSPSPSSSSSHSQSPSHHSPSASPPREPRSEFPTREEMMVADFKNIHTSDYQVGATKRRDFFDSLGAQKRFIKLFDDKNYHSGYSLDLSCITQWNIRRFFETQGWISFLGMHEPSYPYLMKLFYSNLRIPAGPIYLVTFFRGRDLLINEEILARILNIPNEGYDIFKFDLDNFPYPEGHSKDTANIFLHKEPSALTMKDTTESDMYDICRLVSRILNFTILSKNRRGDCFGCHKLLVYLVMNNIPVNLPKLILNIMFQFTQFHSGMGYGMVVTRIFRHYRIDFSGFESFDAPIFNKGRLSRMHLSLRNPRPPGLIDPQHPVPHPPQAPQPPAHQPQAPQPQPAPQPVHQPPHHDDFHYSNRALYEHVREIREEQVRARRERQTMMGYLRRIMSCIGASSTSPRRHRSRSRSRSSRHSNR